jgi:hypothetical protein
MTWFIFVNFLFLENNRFRERAAIPPIATWDMYPVAGDGRANMDCSGDRL